jgi:hypothetical protein
MCLHGAVKESLRVVRMQPARSYDCDIAVNDELSPQEQSGNAGTRSGHLIAKVKYLVSKK